MTPVTWWRVMYQRDYRPWSDVRG